MGNDSFFGKFSGLNYYKAAADEIKVAKPKISVAVADGNIKVTIKKTANAEGYSIFIKGSNDKRYNLIASIEANTKGKTRYTIEGLEDDAYLVRVRAFNDMTYSKYSKAKKVIVNTKDLGLEAVNNARELGGYVNRDGRKIKQGVFLRTANLSSATDTDIMKLTEEYNLGVVMDLRAPVEIDLYNTPDPEIDGVKYINIPIMSNEEYDKMGATIERDMAETKEAGIDDPLLIEHALLETGRFNEDMYINFLSSDNGKEGFKQFFKEILNLPKDRSILFHCSQGKDRTGCCAMLIMYALDIDDEKVVRDFIITNDYNAEKIAADREKLIAKGVEGDELESMMTAKDQVSEKFFRNAINWLYEEYGSPLGYIQKELGITKKQIKQLRKRFLEE